jgi:hypothetical protein
LNLRKPCYPISREGVPEIGTYTLSDVDRRRGLEAARTQAAIEKRRATRELKRQLLEEDVLILWRRGMVPLAIAGKLRIPVSRVSEVVKEAGHEIPSYLTTHGPTPEADICSRCGQPL